MAGRCSTINDNTIMTNELTKLRERIIESLSLSDPSEDFDAVDWRDMNMVF